MARPVEKLADLVRELHERADHLVARIVVFKDQPLATAHPDLAVKTAGGELWRDRERLPWTDPFRAEVREYNVGIAVEAGADPRVIALGWENDLARFQEVRRKYLLDR